MAALAVQFAAAALPPAACVLLAAFCLFFVLFFGIQKRWLSAWMVAACAAVLFVQGAFRMLTLAPVQALAGQTSQVRLEVLETRPGFAEDTCHIRARLLQSDSPQAVGTCVDISNAIFCEPGDILEGELEFLPLKENAFTASKRADGVFLEGESSDLQVMGRSQSMTARVSALRTELSEALRRYLRSDLGGIAAAMAVGDDTDLTSQVETDFRQAGLSHLLVVSGLHISLWAGVWLGITRLLRLHRLGYVLAAGMAVAFAVLVGGTPSVLRALVGFLVWCLCGFFFRSPEPLNSLGLAVLVLTLANPFTYCDVGFLLSASATAGVVTAQLAVGRLPDARRLVARLPVPWWRKGLLAFLRGAAVPFFAALFTLPLQIYMQSGFSLVTVAANLCASPLVLPQLICCWLCAICGAWFPGSGAHRAFSLAAGLFTRLLADLAEWFADLPFGVVQIYGRYALFTAALLFGLGLLLWKWRMARWMFVAGPCLAAMAFGFSWLIQLGSVTVTLVGGSYNPCVVLYDTQEAAVIFRGGESNRQAVEDFLLLHRLELRTVVDLRQGDPASCGLEPAQPTVLLEDVPPVGVKIQALDGVPLAVFVQSDGAMAIAQVHSCTVAANTGKGYWEDMPTIGILAAGPSRPEKVDCDLLLTAYSYDWLAEMDTRVLQGPAPAVRLWEEKMRLERNFA